MRSCTHPVRVVALGPQAGGGFAYCIWLCGVGLAYRVHVEVTLLPCPRVDTCTHPHTCGSTPKQGGAHKQGPNLNGLFGRQSGQAENYSYSTANKNSGIIWGEDTLFEYLLAPKNYIKVRAGVLVY